jgi:hypothetical protein
MSDEKMPAVTLRSAKPVDPKTRHPFSGEALDVGVDKAVPWGPEPDGLTDGLGARVAPPQAFRNVITDLKLRREELDRAIDLLERLMP